MRNYWQLLVWLKLALEKENDWQMVHPITSVMYLWKSLPFSEVSKDDFPGGISVTNQEGQVSFQEPKTRKNNCPKPEYYWLRGKSIATRKWKRPLHTHSGREGIFLSYYIFIYIFIYFLHIRFFCCHLNKYQGMGRWRMWWRNVTCFWTCWITGSLIIIIHTVPSNKLQQRTFYNAR